MNRLCCAGTLVKKFAHNSFAGTFYGVAFTKPNEEFVHTLEKQFQKDSKVLLVCQEGLRCALVSSPSVSLHSLSSVRINSGMKLL